MHVYAIPLRSRFRGLDVREGVLIEGDGGWAEFSPFREYDDAEAAVWWRAAREAADTGWPEPVRDRVPVNATVPAVPPEQVVETLSRFPGCTTAKVKVAADGQSAGQDLARLEAVRDALGPAGKIRIDANAAWDADTAARLLPRYDHAAHGLEYVEQPCPTVEELADLRRRVSVPIAADESIRRADDPLRVARMEAADVAVLKVQPMGGVRACMRIAEQIGLPVVVSSALETSVGIAAGVALAAALPELPYACGLATASLLERDVTDPLIASGGFLPVRRPEPTPEGLEATAADKSVQDWWNLRISRIV
nr:o-succinylbenzoate synthase [Phytoactinopolyspora halotolerans]